MECSLESYLEARLMCVCHQQQAIVRQHRIVSFHCAGDTDQDEYEGHLVGLQIVKHVNPPLVGVG